MVAAWTKALTLKPGNTALRFCLFRAELKPDPKAALGTLTKAAASDPGNSYLQYELAALLFKQVHYSDVHDRYTSDMDAMSHDQMIQRRAEIAQELASKDDAASEQIASNALDAVERGNSGDHYAVPDYAPPVPKLLWHAWNYWGRFARLSGDDFSSMARVRELARATGGYALVSAHLGSEATASRAARACIGMGYKMAGDWPVRDQTPFDDGVLQALVGVAIASIGYADLQQVYTVTGNAVMEQSAQTEAAAYKARVTTYKAAVQQALQTEDTCLYDYY